VAAVFQFEFSAALRRLRIPWRSLPAPFSLALRYDLLFVREHERKRPTKASIKNVVLPGISAQLRQLLVRGQRKKLDELRRLDQVAQEFRSLTVSAGFKMLIAH
jgi:hypothetical protein